MSKMVGHLVPQRVVDSVYCFNPLSRQWKHVFTFAEQRTGCMCFATLDNRIYVTGGQKNDAPYYYVDCYDPATNSLQTVAHTDEGSLSLCATMRVMHENFGL